MSLAAWLQHGEWGGPYRTESVPIRETKEPRSGRTVTGYGRRLPTPYEVQVNGRWRRVRCVCVSNVGTAYIGDINHGATVVTVEWDE